MSRIDAVLDEEVDYGFTGGARYSVNITDLENRFEERDENWKYPKHEFEASFENLTDSAKAAFINVFHVCRGRKHSLKFKDWNDYTIRNQPIQVLPGTTDTIQLYKRYTFGPAWTIRPIQALSGLDGLLDEMLPEIRDFNGDLVAGTFDYLTGQFTPTGMWGAGAYTLSCNFLVWVRLDHDYNQMTIGSWQSNDTDVTLVEDPFAFLPENVPESWDE